MFEFTSVEDDPTKRSYRYEEALEITGNGKYNTGLLFVCFLIIIAMGIDIFGLGIIVAAASKDLRMSLEQVGVLSSMPFAGIIVMSYPWGYLADTKGRKLVLMWAMGGSFVSAAASSLAPNWQTLAALRFVSSALSSAGESATYALLGECCCRRLRARYMLLITSALMLTPTLYYLTAYFVMKMDFSLPFLGIEYRPWRLLTLLMSLPLGISALTLYFFHESPKFLANVGKSSEAVGILHKMFNVNGGKNQEFTVKELMLEDTRKESTTTFSLKSFWSQIAPLFQPPLLYTTLLLYYVNVVVYIANNSFAIMLPTLFNIFFESYAASSSNQGFCALLNSAGNITSGNSSEGYLKIIFTIRKGANALADGLLMVSQNSTINDNTIWAGCAHGISFFLLNAVLSQCAGKRKIMTISILVLAAVAALVIDNTGEPISGLVMFYVFLTTAMINGVVSSYFVDLYPTSYRGMVACLGLMVGRLSAFAGTNILSNVMEDHCSVSFYAVSALVFSGALSSIFLPSDTKKS